MKIGVLTSSRADFGIYLPLLKKMGEDSFFNIEIIAFGTHLSKSHGYTVETILAENFPVLHQISSIITNDDEVSIATAYGLTALKFADFWHQHSFDCVLCLGDRFEMSAAVQAGIPFGVRFAHIHGGETTLGAIDNIYRHQISLAASQHFPATDTYAEKIADLCGSNANVYPVGSLSIEDVKRLSIPDESKFRSAFNIFGEYILLTFHPETVDPARNLYFADEMIGSLSKLAEENLLVITMPNADTYGSIFREALNGLNKKFPQRVILIENFGKLNYFAAMRYCKFLIGNTSSGIIEAASFNKYVINVGDRQAGRAQSENVINVPFSREHILEASIILKKKDTFQGTNIYQKSGTVDLIINHLKKK